MRYRIIAAVASLALAGGTLVVATAAPAGAQVEMTLTATQTNFEYIPAGGQSTANPSNNLVPSIGDVIMVRESLTRGSTVVATTTSYARTGSRTMPSATPCSPYAHASGMVHIVNNSAANASTDTFMF